MKDVANVNSIRQTIAGPVLRTSQFQFTDNPVDGYVLGSDAVGNASWIEPPAGLPDSIVATTQAAGTGQDGEPVTPVQFSYTFGNTLNLGLDSSGNNRTARFATAPTQSVAVTDGTVTRDTVVDVAANNPVRLEDHGATLVTYSNFAISFWLKWSTTADRSGSLFTFDVGFNSVYLDYSKGFGSEGFGFAADVPGGFEAIGEWTLPSASPLDTTDWVHIFFQTGSSGNLLEIDGVDVTTFPEVFYDSGSSASTGSLINLGSFVPGSVAKVCDVDVATQIDSLQIFNRVLSAGERLTLRTSTAPGSSTPPTEDRISLLPDESTTTFTTTTARTDIFTPLRLGNGLQYSYVQSDATTVTLTSANHVVECTLLGGQNVQLPAITAVLAGTEYVIIRAQPSPGNNLFVNVSDAFNERISDETVNTATLSLTQQYQSIRIVCNGVDRWYLL